jgi:hypothetical protein
MKWRGILKVKNILIKYVYSVTVCTICNLVTFKIIYNIFFFKLKDWCYMILLYSEVLVVISLTSSRSFNITSSFAIISVC